MRNPLRGRLSAEAAASPIVSGNGPSAPVFDRSGTPLSSGQFAGLTRRAAERLDDLEVAVSMVRGDDGPSARNRALREAYDTARARLERAKENIATTADIALMERRVRLAREAMERGQSVSTVDVGHSARLEACHEAVTRFITSNRGARFVDIDVTIPAGFDPRAARLDVEGLIVQKQAASEAPEPLEVAERRIIAEIDSLAAQGAPRVVMGIVGDNPNARRPKRRYQAELVWPELNLNAVQTVNPQADPPSVADARALFAWAFRDKMVEEAVLKNREAYGGYGDGPTFTQQERRAELKRIDAEILNLQRLVAECAWADFGSGHESKLMLDGGIDPRAVLGVELKRNAEN